jgi:hypothetical protein
MRGCSDESKNILARVLLSIKWRGGTPMISMMQASCSTSFSPGNKGYPVYLQQYVKIAHFIFMGVVLGGGAQFCKDASKGPHVYGRIVG